MKIEILDTKIIMYKYIPLLDSSIIAININKNDKKYINL